MGGGTTQRAGTEGGIGQWLNDPPLSLHVNGIGEAEQYGSEFITVKATVRNSENTQLGRTISVKDAVLVLNDGKQVKYQMTVKDWARGMRYQAGDENQLTLHFPARQATKDVNRVVVTLFSGNGYGSGNRTSVFRANFPGAQTIADNAPRRNGTSGNKGELLVAPEMAVRLDKAELVKLYGSDFIMVTGIVRNSSPQGRDFMIPTSNAATLTTTNGETVVSSLQAREIGDSSRETLQRGEEAVLKLWFPTRELNDKEAQVARVKVSVNHALTGAAPQTKTFDVKF